MFWAGNEMSPAYARAVHDTFALKNGLPQKSQIIYARLNYLEGFCVSTNAYRGDAE
jgi:hypothetical protein